MITTLILRTIHRPETDSLRRDVGHLFVCTDAYFKGACENLQFTNGVCSKNSLDCDPCITIELAEIEIDNLFGTFQDSISSAGPDQGFICTVWA